MPLALRIDDTLKRTEEILLCRLHVKRCRSQLVKQALYKFRLAFPHQARVHIDAIHSLR